MKNIIKNLSKEVEEILSQNAVSNEMAALIDYGEWSQTDPDFSGLVKRWGLTREQLIEYCNEAKKYADKFNEMFPKDGFKMNPEKGIFHHNDLNPWDYILGNLHCIFMAGELQETEMPA